MEIKTAEFTLSAPMVSMCPQDSKPEYAFIGRSNVGKSSLIQIIENLPKQVLRQEKLCLSTTFSLIENGI